MPEEYLTEEAQSEEAAHRYARDQAGVKPEKEERTPSPARFEEITDWYKKELRILNSLYPLQTRNKAPMWNENTVKACIYTMSMFILYKKTMQVLHN